MLNRWICSFNKWEVGGRDRIFSTELFNPLLRYDSMLGDHGVFHNGVRGTLSRDREPRVFDFNTFDKTMWTVDCVRNEPISTIRTRREGDTHRYKDL
jgi:hypothetical protein